MKRFRLIAFLLVILIMFQHTVFATTENSHTVESESNGGETTELDEGKKESKPIPDEEFGKYIFDEEIFKEMIYGMLEDNSIGKVNSYQNLFTLVNDDVRIVHFPLHSKANDTSTGTMVLLDDDFVRLTPKGTWSALKDSWTDGQLKSRLGTYVLYSQYLNEPLGLKSNGEFVYNEKDGNFDDVYSYMNYYIYSIYQQSDFKNKQHAVGMDNYGNLITNNGDVILPFYMNDYFVDKARQSILNKIKANKNEIDLDDVPLEVSFIPERLPNDMVVDELRKLTSAEGDAFNVEALYLRSNGDQSPTAFYEQISTIKLADKVSPSGSAMGEKDMDGVAEFIIATFTDVISEYNDNMLETAKENKDQYELFVGSTSYNNPNVNNDLEGQWDALIKEGIIGILQGGFGKLIKLSWAFLVNEVYEELFVDFASNYIFDTQTLRDFDIYYVIRNAYTAISIAILLLLFVLSLFKYINGSISLKRMLGTFVFMIMMVMIPFQIFPIITKYVMNYPIQNVLSNQVNQLMLMDRWLHLDKDYFEEQKELFEVEVSRTFRKSEFNYIVSFRTEELINNIELDSLNQTYLDNYGDLETRIKQSKSKEDRYTVNVELNDLLEYYKWNTANKAFADEDVKKIDDSLFEFLGKYKGDKYSGTTNFNEYAFYVTNNNKSKDYSQLRYSVFNPKFPLDDGFIRASDIGRFVFEYYDEIEMATKGANIEETFDNGSLAERARIIASELVYSNTKDVERKDMLLERIHKGLIDFDSSGNNKIYDYTLTPDTSSMDANEAILVQEEYKLLKELIVNESNDSGNAASDTFMIYNLLYSMSDSSTYKPTTADKIKMKEMAYKINSELFDYYINNFWSIKYSQISNSQTSNAIYKEALNDILKLKIGFMIADEFTKNYGYESYQEHMPSDINYSKINGDIYLRGLLIPIDEIHPSNRATDSAAFYVTTERSFFTNLAFVIALGLLIAYGLLKLIVITVCIIPIALVMTIIKNLLGGNEEDLKSSWIGASYILGIFAVVNLLLILLWYGLSMGLNNYASANLSAKSSVFNTFTNLTIIFLYLGFTLKMILMPTVKIAAKNLGDLGASKFTQIAQSKIDKVKGAINRVQGKVFAGKVIAKNSKDVANKTINEKLDDYKKKLGMDGYRKEENVDPYKSNEELLNRLNKEESETEPSVSKETVKEKTVENENVNEKSTVSENIKAEPNVAEVVNGVNVAENTENVSTITDTNENLNNEKIVNTLGSDFGMNKANIDNPELYERLSNIEGLKVNDVRGFTKVNGIAKSVLSGSSERIGELGKSLTEDGIDFTKTDNEDGTSSIELGLSDIENNSKYSDLEGIESKSFGEFSAKDDLMTEIYLKKQGLSFSKDGEGNINFTQKISSSSDLVKQSIKHTDNLNDMVSRGRDLADGDELFKEIECSNEEAEQLALAAEAIGDNELSNIIRFSNKGGKVRLDESTYNRFKSKFGDLPEVDSDVVDNTEVNDTEVDYAEADNTVVNNVINNSEVVDNSGIVNNSEVFRESQIVDNTKKEVEKTNKIVEKKPKNNEMLNELLGIDNKSVNEIVKESNELFGETVDILNTGLKEKDTLEDSKVDNIKQIIMNRRNKSAGE